MGLTPNSNFFMSQEEVSDTNRNHDNAENEKDNVSSSSSSADDRINSLEDELVAAKAKADENYDRFLRMAAEFENARKRWEKEKQDIRIYGNQEFAKDLLPVIDAFEKALTALEESSSSPQDASDARLSSIIEGVSLVSKVFMDSVKKHGIERLPGKGSPFNPSYHNAIAKAVDPSLKEETVVEEFVPGYKIGERILRTAMVKIATPD